MHVAVASHHRLPAEGYGGSQRVVVALIHGLLAHGHKVTLLAPAGSAIPGVPLVPFPPKHQRDGTVNWTGLTPADADIVHAHFPVPRPPDRPFLQTLHGNLKAGEPVCPNTVFLSRDHARRHGSEIFVYNGLDPADYAYSDRKEPWDLFLGRLHTAKGYQWAVEGSKRTGQRLILAGGWRPTFSRGIKYVGEVDGKEKAELLSKARCLWMPAQWDEPFGLTNIEALLSGTPVLGTRRGALPEILTPEVGALSDTLDEMIDASKTIDTRQPAACRAHAEQYFTHLVMAEEYVRMYRHLLDRGTLPPGHPTPYTRV
jgi:glycosyltransferase involved in cell wall biosynthesis